MKAFVTWFYFDRFLPIEKSPEYALLCWTLLICSALIMLHDLAVLYLLKNERSKAARIVATLSGAPALVIVSSSFGVVNTLTFYDWRNWFSDAVGDMVIFIAGPFVLFSAIAFVVRRYDRWQRTNPIVVPLTTQQRKMTHGLLYIALLAFAVDITTFVYMRGIYLENRLSLPTSLHLALQYVHAHHLILWGATIGSVLAFISTRTNEFVQCSLLKRNRQCINCAYDQRNLTSDICPECGAKL